MNLKLSILVGLSFCVTCSKGSECNPGWTKHDGKCFFIPDIYDADVRMARRYCNVYGGDLAFVNNSDILDFILNLPSYHADFYSYWIKEDSVPVGENTTSPSYSMCASLYSHNVRYAQCNTVRPFICEMRMQSNEETRCSQNWYTFGTACYSFGTTPLKYNESVLHCSNLGARLAILDDLLKEHQASAVILRQNATFFVDAKRVNGTFKWSSGRTFQPSCVNCVEQNTGDCLGYESDSDHPLEFKWVPLTCDSRNNFLCEKGDLESASVSRVASSTVSTPSSSSQLPVTVLPPSECPVGFNWKPHEESGFCYWETTYEAEKLNWHQARAFCQAYGGDLATYRNEEQEKYGLGGAVGHYKGLWFGLERTQNNNFHWVDGTPLNYTNWESAPERASRSKFCGMHGPDDGKWELDYCGVRRWFVCKAPKVQNPTHPDLDKLNKKTPCHVSSPSVYRHQWFLHEEYCYMVHEDPRYSWSMARNFCNDNGAHLASIHSFEETDFILSLVSLTSSTDYWIGLSSMGLGSSRTWSDQSPLDFLYWDENNPVSGVDGINSCVTFNKQRGYWQNQHCNQFLNVVCKRKLNSTSELPISQPTLFLPGNCEKGWYASGNHCYKSFGERWSQKVEWGEAKDNCESIGATLASVHTNEEQDFLTDMLLDLNSDAWIGLQSVDRGTTYEWSDDTQLDYANWDENEPAYSSDAFPRGDEYTDYFLPSSIPSNTCVKMTSKTENTGKWKEVGCSYKNSYICKKPKNASITEPSENLFECSNITNWSRLGSSCYGIFNESVQWSEAQKKCRMFNADLVSFKNEALNMFLKKRLSNKHPFYWTGIRLIAKNEYGQLNGKRLEFTNWLAGQPRKVSHLMDNCVAMNLNTKWVVRNCKENFTFICQWNSDNVKTEDIVERRHTCPNISEWEDIGTDTCYLFHLDWRVTWDDAMTYCFRHGGHLASFHSNKEAAIVRQHILDNTAASFVHIGLGKRQDGSYGWVDHTAVDFVQWDEDEPQKNEYNCVQLFIRTGKWRSVDCDISLRGFICSSTRDTNVKDSLVDNSSERDIVNTKLAVGGYIGIAICVMVVFAIIAVTAYYVGPNNRMRVQLLESP